MTAKTQTARINALDLTVDQIEQIESMSGIPLDEWPKTTRRLHLYRYVYGVATDTPDELVGRMTLRALTDAIVLEDEATPDPT